MASSSARPVITLTTDFGTSDHYVGTMKCVIANLCPEARIIDITHEIAPSDLLSAAYAVSQAAPYSPAGSVHIVVVDPGVGTSRRAIAVRNWDKTYIGPDNGVLSFALPEAGSKGVRELTNNHLWLPNASATFHGRDLFAPAGAHIAAGDVKWESVGAEVKDWVVLPNLHPQLEYSGRWSGIVLSIDRFGNVITNFKSSMDAIDSKSFMMQANATAVQRFCRTFAESNSADPFVYAGSSGYLEIAINQGNAAEVLAIRVGDPVVLELNG